jgi:hypothetical protein
VDFCWSQAGDKKSGKAASLSDEEAKQLLAKDLETLVAAIPFRVRFSLSPNPSAVADYALTPSCSVLFACVLDERAETVGGRPAFSGRRWREASSG